jgi:archaellum component FlaC
MDTGEIARKIKDYIGMDIPLIQLIPVATQISNYLDEVQKEVMSGNMNYEDVKAELMEIVKVALQHGIKLTGDIDEIAEKITESLLGILKYSAAISQGQIRLQKKRTFFT